LTLCKNQNALVVLLANLKKFSEEEGQMIIETFVRTNSASSEQSSWFNSNVISYGIWNSSNPQKVFLVKLQNNDDTMLENG